MLFLKLALMIASITFVTAYPQQGQPGAGGGGSGGQDPCAQYQSQCVEGSGMAAQGAQSAMGAFPNNPIPVGQMNMTAAQQMPVCQGLGQACTAQGQSPPTAPSAPAMPGAPAAPGAPGGGGGLFSSFKNFFSL